MKQLTEVLFHVWCLWHQGYEFFSKLSVWPRCLLPAQFLFSLPPYEHNLYIISSSNMPSFISQQPACRLILKFKHNCFKRDLLEKKTPHRQAPVNMPFSFSPYLYMKCRCGCWSCNRWTSWSGSDLEDGNHTRGMAEPKARGKLRDWWNHTSLGLPTDAYVKEKLILFSLSHQTFRSLLPVDQFNQNWWIPPNMDKINSQKMLIMTEF